MDGREDILNPTTFSSDYQQIIADVSHREVREEEGHEWGERTFIFKLQNLQA